MRGLWLCVLALACTESTAGADRPGGDAGAGGEPVEEDGGGGAGGLPDGGAGGEGGEVIPPFTDIVEVELGGYPRLESDVHAFYEVREPAGADTPQPRFYLCADLDGGDCDDPETFFELETVVPRGDHPLDLTYEFPNSLDPELPDDAEINRMGIKRGNSVYASVFGFIEFGRTPNPVHFTGEVEVYVSEYVTYEELLLKGEVRGTWRVDCWRRTGDPRRPHERDPEFESEFCAPYADWLPR